MADGPGPYKRNGHRAGCRILCWRWPQPEPSPLPTAAPELRSLNTSLRRVHLGVLVGLALSALVVALGAPTTPAPGPFPGYSLAALLVAGVSIVARREPQRPITNIRPILRRTVLGLAFAGLLGPLGLLIALREGAQTTGLLYALAGAFLSLRPPPQVVIRDRPEDLAS